MQRTYELERVLVTIGTTMESDWMKSKLLWGEKTFSSSERVRSKRKKKAPKVAATTVGVRGGTTEP